MDTYVHVRHCPCPAEEKLDTIITMLRDLKSQGEKLMTDLENALAALKKIDEATTKQGQVIQSDADLLQKTSDNIDALVAKLDPAHVDKSIVDGLQAAADKAQAISDSLDKQAEFAKALASKGVANPVPVPPPAPTP